MPQPIAQAEERQRGRPHVVEQPHDDEHTQPQPVRPPRGRRPLGRANMPHPTSAYWLLLVHLLLDAPRGRVLGNRQQPLPCRPAQGPIERADERPRPEDKEHVPRQPLQKGVDVGRAVGPVTLAQLLALRLANALADGERRADRTKGQD